MDLKRTYSQSNSGGNTSNNSPPPTSASNNTTPLDYVDYYYNQAKRYYHQPSSIYNPSGTSQLIVTPPTSMQSPYPQPLPAHSNTYTASTLLPSAGMGALFPSTMGSPFSSTSGLSMSFGAAHHSAATLSSASSTSSFYNQQQHHHHNSQQHEQIIPNPHSSPSSPVDIPTTLLQYELSLVQRLKPILIPPPVSYIYSPLEYAYEPHADYVRKYCRTAKKILFLGMNPGPWGMSQTGIPFGEVNLVKNWLKIEGRIGKPLIEHPSRIIEGFNCPRSEVSGQRFWSYWKDLCKEPDVLFKYCYVHNYCPLAFMKDSGRNVTPPELKSRERNLLFSACDETLIKIIQLLQVEIVIGIGKFPQQRTQIALQSCGLLNQVRVESILHPSPVNPTANKGWRDVVHRQLGELGLLQWVCGGGMGGGY